MSDDPNEKGGASGAPPRSPQNLLSPRNPSSRRNAWGRARRAGFGLALGLALALALAEVVARVAIAPVPERGGAGRMTTELIELRPDDPELRWTLRPGARVAVVYPGVAELGPAAAREVVYEISAQGLRDRPFEVPKPAGRVRVVALGDSFTFGTGVALEETFPKTLERALAEARSDLDVEVLNCGVEGWDTVQEVAFLEQRVDELEPDLVLLVAYLNDAVMPPGAPQAPGVPDPGLPSSVLWIQRLGLSSAARAPGEAQNAAEARTAWLRRHSRLADLVAHRVYRSLTASATEEGVRRAWRPGSPALVRMGEALDRAAELADERGFALQAALYPATYGHGGGAEGDRNHYAYLEQHARFAALCEERGIAVHDLLPALASLGSVPVAVHPHDMHPSAAANRAVGAALARELAPELTGGLTGRAARLPDGAVEPAED